MRRKWAAYAAKASEAMKIYGGTPIVRGGQMTVAEGEGRARNIVIEFADFASAKAYTARRNMPRPASCAKARARSTSS
jgi:uncharacterized protein (DUF1330 family)